MTAGHSGRARAHREGSTGRQAWPDDLRARHAPGQGELSSLQGPLVRTTWSRRKPARLVVLGTVRCAAEDFRCRRWSATCQTGISLCAAGVAVPKCKCSSLWSLPRCMGTSCQLLVGLPGFGSGDGCMRCAQTYAQWPNHAPDALKVYDNLVAQAPNGEPLTSGFRVLGFARQQVCAAHTPVGMVAEQPASPILQ